MKTRSQTRIKICYVQTLQNPITRSMDSYEQKAKYSFIFDFDDSSLNWRKNKISVGNGSFEYKN